MMKKNRLSQAILWSLAATATTGLQAQDEQNEEERGSREIEKIVVTATKTEEVDLQEAPVTVQAIGEEELAQQNIGNFDDLRNSIPSLNAASRGPGQQTIYIRGMAVQPITVLLSGAQGTQPNVALYLDEQPVTAPGRNLDVYATDLRRIEVLPGPQGTLFGASSQAGTIRYITNKPDLAGFDAGFSAEASFTKDGEMNSAGEGFLNIPLGRDTAVRAAFYNVQLGGYIDNVQGTFSVDPRVNPESNVQVGFNGPDTYAITEDTTFEEANNAALTEDNFNDSFYKGVRLSGYHEFNPDWNLLLQNTYQELGADGVFDYDPEVGDLDVQRFFPDELDDKFNQTAWTVEGRAGMLDLIYTGAYLYREVEQSVDYTGYNNAGAFIYFYTCTYDFPGGNAVLDDCLDPVKGTKIKQDHTRNTHEFRISTPAENRWRFVGGAFFDDYELETQDDYFYLAVDDLGFAPNAPISDAFQVNPETRPPGVAFFNDIFRSETTIAAFGELSYDIVPDVLTLTGGARVYEIEADFKGSSNFAQKGTDGDAGRDYDEDGGHRPEPITEEDIITRVNLSWRPTNEVMLYATRSEGFRPPGWNRGGGIPSVNPDFPDVSATYETDDVVNWELGWKTLLFDNSLRINGSTYFIEWTDMQVSRFDPENVSILTFIENSADSEIFGVEADFTWRATENLTLFGAVSYNDTELTSVDAQVIELAPVGSQLPLVPELQGYLRARYEQSLDVDFLDRGYVQLSGKFASNSFSSLVAEERRRQAGYGILDARAGVSRENWTAELFVENFTDKRAELFINTQDDIPRITTNRPLTAGIRLSYRFLPF
jgi:outer membrane receptor protein involved in Fe transport